MQFFEGELCIFVVKRVVIFCMNRGHNLSFLVNPMGELNSESTMKLSHTKDLLVFTSMQSVCLISLSPYWGIAASISHPFIQYLFHSCMFSPSVCFSIDQWSGPLLTLKNSISKGYGYIDICRHLQKHTNAFRNVCSNDHKQMYFNWDTICPPLSSNPLLKLKMS